MASHHLRASASVSGGSKYRHRDRNAVYNISASHTKLVEKSGVFTYHQTSASVQCSQQSAHSEPDFATHGLSGMKLSEEGASDDQP